MHFRWLACTSSSSIFEISEKFRSFQVLLVVSLQGKNIRIGPFPWKRSVLQNPDRERTNQSTGVCHIVIIITITLLYVSMDLAEHSCFTKSNQMLVLGREENRSTGEKSQSREPTNSTLIWLAGQGIEPLPDRWKASALIVAPTLSF